MHYMIYFVFLAKSRTLLSFNSISLQPVIAFLVFDIITLFQDGKDPGHDLITKMLGLRQKLLKTPNIPAAPSLDLPTSELDAIICATKPLDCSGAKERISLLRRSRVPRRAISRYGYNVALSNRLSQTMTQANLLDSAMFRRSLLR